MGKTGFSWKRATGISSMKRKISKATGVPTTKAGRKRKAQTKIAHAATGGCLTVVLPFVLAFIAAIVLLIIVL